MTSSINMSRSLMMAVMALGPMLVHAQVLSNSCQSTIVNLLPFDLNGIGGLVRKLSNLKADFGLDFTGNRFLNETACGCLNRCLAVSACSTFVYKPSPEDGDYQSCYLKSADQPKLYKTIFLADTSIELDGSFATTAAQPGTFSQSSCLNACKQSSTCNYITFGTDGKCFLEPGSPSLGRVAIFVRSQPATSAKPTNPPTSKPVNPPSPTGTGSDPSKSGADAGSSTSSSMLPIGLGVAAIVLIVLLAGVGFFVYRRRQQKDRALEMKSLPNPATSFYLSPASQPQSTIAVPEATITMPSGPSPIPSISATPNQNSFQGSGGLWTNEVRVNEKGNIGASPAAIELQSGSSTDYKQVYSQPPIETLQITPPDRNNSLPAWTEKQALSQTYGMQGANSSQGVTAFPTAESEKRALAENLASEPLVNVPIHATSVPSNVASWTPEQVTAALVQAGASPFAISVLKDNNVNGFGLLVLDQRSLVALGFNDIEAQQVLNVINVIRAGSGLVRSATTEAPPQYS
ncbi:hypothetical protein HDU97_008249 [Phlyctochytrium planicorne]|nr:hypothetical protein HDU97_008249 [Phlyctochytrium planicorne]